MSFFFKNKKNNKVEKINIDPANIDERTDLDEIDIYDGVTYMDEIDEIDDYHNNISPPINQLISAVDSEIKKESQARLSPSILIKERSKSSDDVKLKIGFIDKTYVLDSDTLRLEFDKNITITHPIVTNYSFHIIDFIGKGAFSNVYKAKFIKTLSLPTIISSISNKNNHNSSDSKFCAFKTVIAKPNYIKCAHNEYIYFKELNNKSDFIIHCYDLFTLNNNTIYPTPVLVFEYFDQEFYQYMKQNFVPGYGLKRNILMNLAEALFFGLDFLHSKNIIHCDLKPENIVINKKNKIKIIDLGSAIKYPYDTRKSCYMQSRYYRAPNCIVKSNINHRIDYWSVGCILYEAITIIPLFCKSSEKQILFKQLRFIDIPHEKLNQESRWVKRYYDYDNKIWNIQIEKNNLQSYTLAMFKTNSIINREDTKWLFDNYRGYFKLIEYCLLNHYSSAKNDYLDIFDKVQRYYNSKFPSISTV